MKFARLLFICLFLNFDIKSADNKPIRLDNPILGIIDGVKGLMDADKIHKIMFLMRELYQFKYGILDVSNKTVPQHLYKDKFYTLEQLVKLEEEVEKLKTKDPIAYQKDKDEIAKTLEKLKEAFWGFTNKVMLENKGADEQTYMFIDNFISKYGDSILKYWRIDKDAYTSLHKRVTSFKLCFAMAFDLYQFLMALVRSLPKAYKQWKDLQAQANAQNNQANAQNPKSKS